MAAIHVLVTLDTGIQETDSRDSETAAQVTRLGGDTYKKRLNLSENITILHGEERDEEEG